MTLDDELLNSQKLSFPINNVKSNILNISPNQANNDLDDIMELNEENRQNLLIENNLNNLELNNGQNKFNGNNDINYEIQENSDNKNNQDINNINDNNYKNDGQFGLDKNIIENIVTKEMKIDKKMKIILMI